MELLGWLGGTVVVLLAAAIAQHNLRIWRLRRKLRSLPPGTRQAVLDLLAALPPGPSQLLVTAEGPPDPSPTGSHLGGLPFGEEGEEWPRQSDGSPSPFMLQVRLEHEGLGPVWQGRLVTVFLQDDLEQTVRSYAPPQRGRTLEPPAGAVVSPAIPLRAVNLPAAEGEDSASDPKLLVRKVPALAELLRPLGRDTAGLLAQILEPRYHGYELPAESTVIVGGEPELIQNPHEAECPDCREPMRFLFQFGDVVAGIQMGDAGVCYVYGCDRHPHRCLGFVDSH